jgi:F-type H+-transporting ATPase subunit delta
MRVDRVARRYAQAVFELAQENGDFDAWARDLDRIASVMAQPEVASILRSERVRGADKTALLEQLLSGVRPTSLNLARVLIANDRVDYAPAIRDAFQAMLDARRGVVHARVTSAVPLADAEKAQLSNKLAAMTGGQVDLQTEVNPDLIGGLVVRIGDRLIDGSVRAKLVALRRQLEGVAS